MSRWTRPGCGGSCASICARTGRSRNGSIMTRLRLRAARTQLLPFRARPGPPPTVPALPSRPRAHRPKSPDRRCAMWTTSSGSYSPDTFRWQAVSSPGTPPQTRAEIIRQFLPSSPYVGHLGIQLTAMQPDLAVLILPFTPALVTIGTTVHGGAIASLIDTAAMVAAWSDSAVPATLRGSTVSLTVVYLAPAE